MRLVNGDAVSEWLPKGTFYTNRRFCDGDYWRIEAYDAMRKADSNYLPDTVIDDWPKPMSEAVAEIAAAMGVEIDPRTNINPAYMLEMPVGYTRRQVLAHIAAAHGGNWIISDAGMLWLIPLTAVGQTTEHYVGLDVVDFENTGQHLAISRVTLSVDSEHVYTAGDDTGTEISAYCPSANQEITNSVLQKLKGAVYQSYTAVAANVDPAAELGDGVNVGEVQSIIARIVDAGNRYPDISAPGAAELEEEYPGGGPLEQEVKRELAKTRSIIEKTSEQILLRVENVEGEYSELDVKVDSIKLEVSQNAGADGKVYSSIELTVGDNTYTGMILMEGNINVSGQLSADALYAAKGDIADLTVDRLSTSRRIVKYLAGDTSDDNYIKAEDETLAFISGIYDGDEEQAVNPNGLALYWEQSIAGATLGADGYPYIDGVRVFTTTGVTAWPVMVYTYAEDIKARIAFEQDEKGYYTPVFTFGAGDGTGNNQAFLHKTSDSMLLTYKATGGKEIGMRLGYDGYTDIAGLRKTAELDFSEWENGTFYERVDGEETHHARRVIFDDAKKPITITDSDGHAMNIKW